VEVGKVQWKIDFSDCGLVVSRVQAKVKWVDFEEEVEEPAQFTMVGDDNVMCAPYLGGRWGVWVWVWVCVGLQRRIL